MNAGRRHHLDGVDKFGVWQGERMLWEIWERCLADPTATAEKLSFKKTC